MQKFKIKIANKSTSKSFVRIFLFASIIVLGFFACKRSIFKHNGREYDAKLVRTLKKLEFKYADKKIRINTWDKKADAYQDIAVIDEYDQKIATLTIGDSVKFVSIDFSQPNGIRAKIEVQNDNVVGYIPYWEVEEFEPAVRIDPDLED